MEALTISYVELTLRLLVSVVLCGLVGFEREVRDQPAGFRTHILLGLGATLFTLVSAYGFEPFTEAATGRSGITFDPTRIAAQIVTGVGFLGAGAIIRQGGDVRGLTTAASLWTVASIGTAAGAGYLFGATAATAVVLATLFALRWFRATIIERFRLDTAYFAFTLREPTADPSTAIEKLEDHGVSIRTMEAELDDRRASFRLQVRIHPPRDVRGALNAVAGLPEVEKISISGLRDPE